MNVLIVFLFCNTVRSACLDAKTMIKSCKTRLDCRHDQCCVKHYYTNIPQCEPLTDEGDYCFTDLSDKLEPIKLKCPCKPDLFCNQTQKKCQVQPPQPIKKNCKTGDDCNKDECCVKNFYENQGTCHPLTKEAKYCLTDLRNQSRSEVFTGVCPCRTESVCYHDQCIPIHLYENVKKEEEKQREKQCNIGEDCPDNMCCFYDPLSSLPDKKYCMPLLQMGQNCNEDLHGFLSTNVKEGYFTKLCPCKQGLYCRSTYYEGPKCREIKPER